VEFAGFKKVINLTVIPVPGAAPHFCLSHPLGFAVLGADKFALFVKTWAKLASPSRNDNIAITRSQGTYIDYNKTTFLSDFDSTTMATLGHDGDETIAWFEDDTSAVCCADSWRDTESLLRAWKIEGRITMSHSELVSGAPASQHQKSHLLLTALMVLVARMTKELIDQKDDLSWSPNLIRYDLCNNFINPEKL
jgi:hypothetical protein